MSVMSDNMDSAYPDIRLTESLLTGFRLSCLCKAVEAERDGGSCTLGGKAGGVCEASADLAFAIVAGGDDTPFSLRLSGRGNSSYCD